MKTFSKLTIAAIVIMATLVAAPVAYAEEAEPPTASETTAPEPEATEPEATEPEATEPEATEPEATEPEATEPEATEPEATDDIHYSIDEILDEAIIWLTALAPSASAIIGSIVAMLKIIQVLRDNTTKMKRQQDAALAQTRIDVEQMLTDQIEEQQRQMELLRKEIRILSSNAQIKKTTELAEEAAKLAKDLQQSNAKIIALMETKGVAFK